VAGVTSPGVHWAELYRSRLTTAAEAVKAVRSGDRIWVQSGCSAPVELLEALVARACELHDVEISHILTLGPAHYVKPECQSAFRHRALFVGPNVRAAVNQGLADFVPVHLHQIPLLIKSGVLPIDVVLAHLTPPDEHGFCSYGVEVGCCKAAAERARTVIALVNPQMPRALGDSFIHVSRITHVVEVDRLPNELQTSTEVSEESRAIGQNVAELIEDGSTLQMGIGEIPDAVLMCLGNKRDLGIHTELFSDGLVGLVESGVVTNERKTLHRGKAISGFVLGGRKSFEFMHNNPFCEFHPTDYVNDPFVIAQNDAMVAINSALAVDLTGQVCADSIGRSIYSGFGGQVDFIRGAARSKGGKPIIALPATAKDGTLSRICDVLEAGAGVVTSRADVHYVVTEFGVATLWGKSLRERARELIAIAHPKFRAELSDAARRRNL
jgi:4-hydroxybutyrate CoA-transferase